MRNKLELVLALLLFAGFAAISMTGVSAMASETITYSYDVHGRLVRVTHAGTVNNNVVTNYTLDAADNRVNVNVTGAP